MRRGEEGTKGGEKEEVEAEALEESKVQEEAKTDGGKKRERGRKEGGLSRKKQEETGSE